MSKMAMFFNDYQTDILQDAINEYELRYYESKSEEWQREINDLIETLNKRGVEN